MNFKISFYTLPVYAAVLVTAAIAGSLGSLQAHAEEMLDIVPHARVCATDPDPERAVILLNKKLALNFEIADGRKALGVYAPGLNDKREIVDKLTYLVLHPITQGNFQVTQTGPHNCTSDCFYYACALASTLQR